MSEERRCRNCDKPLPAPPPDKPGARPVYCSDICRKVAKGWKPRMCPKCGGEVAGTWTLCVNCRDEPAAPGAARECKRCGSSLSASKMSARAIFCTFECKNMWHKEKVAKEREAIGLPPPKLGRRKGSQNAEALEGEATHTRAIQAELETRLWIREREIVERFRANGG